MSNWGMTNRIAETPEQALELLSQAAARGAPYDIAIIDLGGPGMDALELARAIKASPAIAKVRLVMLAPVGRHGEMEDARHAGVDACLAKPVRQTALYECLVSVMAGQAKRAMSRPLQAELSWRKPAAQSRTPPAGGRQSRQPAGRARHPGARGLPGDDGQQRAGGARRIPARRLRSHPDGLPHAGDGRIRRHPKDPRTRKGHQRMGAFPSSR